MQMGAGAGQVLREWLLTLPGLLAPGSGVWVRV